MPRQAWILLFWGVLESVALVGCDGCGASLGLSASGDRPYVRCLAANPPSERDVKAGGLGLKVEGRELRIEGAALPLRIAAFAGAGFADPPKAGGLLDTLPKSGAKLVLVLGGMGDTAERARLTAQRLLGFGLPVVFVAGGRDARERYLPALAGHEGIVDATALDRVRIGKDTLLPVAGSSRGRYALDDAACGFGLADLKERATRLGPAPSGERRWLVSWEAPAGPLTRAPAAVGDPDLAELATRLGAHGGLHAWPELHVGEPFAGESPLQPDVVADPFSLALPRGWGPWQQRADGERTPPGFALLELSESGLQLVSGQKN